MSSILKMEETDYGTKRKTKRALDRFWKAIPREIQGAMREYVYELLRKSYQLCPKDTGTLASTIRIEGKGKEYKHFEVKRSNYTLGNWRLVAGGKKIHPRTRKIVAYAAAVHDGHATRGGGWVAGRPFLSQALQLVGDRGLKSKVDKYWKKITKEWIRD